MVGPSKILTVSYGTFSCTLEGFDNPFSTMRGIAEYFRDLAADDRYFGAEPPIPDAEMLHRIAAADANKPVLAHVEDNGVTLRQVEPEVVEPEVAEHQPAEPDYTPDAVVNDPFVDEPADIVALGDTSRNEAESVAAKLARIRAVVSNTSLATDADQPSNVEEFTSAPISTAFEDADFEETDHDEAEEQHAQEQFAAETALVDEEATDTVAENIADAEPEAPIAEVETPEPVAETAFSEPEVVEPEVADFSETNDIETDDIAADSAAEQSFDAEPEQSDPIDVLADESVAQFMGEPEVQDYEDSEEASAADLEEDSSTISRIVKMRRVDFEAAQGPGNFEGTYQDLDPKPVSTLSPEDEADLMATLAQVQRKADAEGRADKEGRALLENQDINSSTESVSRILEVTNSELNESEGTRRRSAIAHLKAAVAATRADKNLAKQREEEEADDLNQYRNDLAKVVRPRRPSDDRKPARQAPLVLVSEQRVNEPETETVSDDFIVQPRRVSSDDVAEDGDLAGQGNDAQSENMFMENNTFADFVQDMGASELPDLLEAAAAYSAFVEGNEHFSRPQIMQAVAAIREEEFSREEGLRSFGLLLRRGKIKKLKRGRFVVAETTRFHPHSRAVGE